MKTKKIFELTKRQWRWIGQYAIKLAKNDIRQGIMQDGKSNLQYKSETYKKYKANDMRKFTQKGERLKQYKGVSISSNEVSFVNLTLTGKMLNDMFESVIDRGVEIHFSSKDADKVLGAEEQGRVILTLRDENIKTIENEFVKIFNQNIKQLKKLELQIQI